jgi:hypothetical protein
MSRSLTNFLIYLISHDRPMAGVLAARHKDIKAEFERGFVGMTRQPVALDDLLGAREALISDIVAQCLILIANSCWGLNEASPTGRQSA